MARMKVALLGLLLAVAGAASAQADGAGGWQVAPVANGGGGCSARLAGPQVDMLLLYNKDGKLVLGAGSPTWNRWDRTFDSVLSIDGGPPQHLTGDSVGSLFLGLTTDSELKQLRGAHAIDWTLPSGKFHVSVEGLGAAFDQVAACQKAG